MAQHFVSGPKQPHYVHVSAHSWHIQKLCLLGSGIMFSEVV